MNLAQLTAEAASALRSDRPMVHHITNTVVMNFTANITLCLGAAPVMAPSIQESGEMVGFAGALLLNIGTLDPALIDSMIHAGRRANELGIPVLLDPVGAGATALRTESSARILESVRLSVIRGNAGEILAVAGHGGRVRGVDSMDSVEGKIDVLRELASETGSVIAATGATDVITDGTRAALVSNGNPMMGRITGTGCGASTAVACFLAVQDDAFSAAASALIAYGIAGEMAAEISAGPGTFVPRFLDSLSALDEETILARTRAVLH